MSWANQLRREAEKVGGQRRKGGQTGVMMIRGVAARHFYRRRGLVVLRGQGMMGVSAREAPQVGGCGGALERYPAKSALEMQM